MSRCSIRLVIFASLLPLCVATAAKKRRVRQELFKIVRAGHYPGELAEQMDRDGLYEHVFQSGREIIFQTGKETYLHVGVKVPTWPVRIADQSTGGRAGGHSGPAGAMAVATVLEPVLDPIHLVTRGKVSSLVSPHVWLAPFLPAGEIIRLPELKDVVGAALPDSPAALMRILGGASVINVWKATEMSGIDSTNRQRHVQIILDALERFDGLIAAGHDFGVDHWTARSFFR